MNLMLLLKLERAILLESNFNAAPLGKCIVIQNIRTAIAVLFGIN